MVVSDITPAPNKVIYKAKDSEPRKWKQEMETFYIDFYQYWLNPLQCSVHPQDAADGECLGFVCLAVLTELGDAGDIERCRNGDATVRRR